jgi:hypothetical protein
MNTVFTNENSDLFDNDLEKSKLEFAILCNEANRDYLLATSSVMFTEASKPEAVAKKNNIFLSTISKIFKGIKTFLDGIINRIKGYRAPKANTQDILKSGLAKKMYNDDVKDLKSKIDYEYREGNKLIQDITSATGISDEEVEKRLNSIAKVINEHKPSSLAEVITGLMAGGGIAAMTAYATKNANNLNATINDLVNGAHNISDIAKKQILKVFEHFGADTQDIVGRLGKGWEVASKELESDKELSNNATYNKLKYSSNFRTFYEKLKKLEEEAKKELDNMPSYKRKMYYIKHLKPDTSMLHLNEEKNYAMMSINGLKHRLEEYVDSQEKKSSSHKDNKNDAANKNQKNESDKNITSTVPGERKNKNVKKHERPGSKNSNSDSTNSSKTHKSSNSYESISKMGNDIKNMINK